MSDMKVSPQVIPGIVHSQNNGAFEWGWQGLVAYGCHSSVVVVDPKSVQALQVLSQHKSNVVKVRWYPECHHHSIAQPYTLRLASVDASSYCVIWDVGQGMVLSEFSLGNGKALVDLQWLTTNDSCRDLLAVMLSPSSMTIWNSDTGTAVSRFAFTEVVMAFAFDPFIAESLIMKSTDCFIFVNDFDPSQAPSQASKKFYLTSSSSSAATASVKKGTAGRYRRLMSSDSRPDDTATLNDCIQMVFSQTNRGHLLLLYSREIVILDTSIRQIIGSVPLERNTSPFLQIMPCRQRDVLYALHENGCISLRIRTSPQTLQPSSSPLDQTKVSEIQYYTHTHSEPLRISKSCQILSGAVCPTTELDSAVFTSEGKILFWALKFDHYGTHGQELSNEAPPIVLAATPSCGNALLSGEETRALAGGVALTLQDYMAPRSFVPPQAISSNYSLLSSRMLLEGLWTGITSYPTSVRMCPPLTTKNWSSYKPLLAIGMTNGSVQVFNLATKSVVKEYSIHAYPVLGLEWLTQSSIISYCSVVNVSSCKNEIAVTNLYSGHTTHIKRSDSGNHAPIECVKVSIHRNYFVINYKDKPLEFWDASTLTFLRELVSHPPSFKAVEWCPSHGRTKTQKPDAGAITPTPTVDFDVAMGTMDTKIHTPEREYVSVMSTEGDMWQLSVEGSKIKVLSSTPVQTWLSNPQCIAWKGDMMVAGDTEGILTLYDAKNAQGRTLDASKAVVRKIRFAPGKGNSKFFVLCNTKLDIRDINADQLLAQMKWSSKDSSALSVEDVDWITSDKPVLLTSDGCLRVYDLKLVQCHSSIQIKELAEPVFCPRTMPALAGFRLKAMLQHQSWNVNYTLSTLELEDETTTDKEVKYQLSLVPRDVQEALSKAPRGIPQRCFITANLFGDQREANFWSLAMYFILREMCRRQDPRYLAYCKREPLNPNSDVIRPNSEASVRITSSWDRDALSAITPLVDLSVGEIQNISVNGTTCDASLQASKMSPNEVTAMLQDASSKAVAYTPPLDFCHDIYCDSDTYKKMQLERVLLHESKRYTYELTRKCADALLFLGQTDVAVQLLLETNPPQP
ncbi:hypothetical protein EMCRGX_G029528 [Ephydatia muelleri]